MANLYKKFISIELLFTDSGRVFRQQTEGPLFIFFHSLSFSFFLHYFFLSDPTLVAFSAVFAVFDSNERTSSSSIIFFFSYRLNSERVRIRIEQMPDRDNEIMPTRVRKKTRPYKKKTNKIAEDKNK